MELYSRKVGALPVSIGTSMALESIFIRTKPSYDPDRKAPQVIQLSNYNSIWFNVETLVRNIASSVDRLTFMGCNVNHILEILNTEIEIITSIFQIEGMGVVKPYFFYDEFRSLRGRKHVLFRPSNTLNQRSYDLKTEQVLKKLNASTDSVWKFDSDIKPPQQDTALIVTHFAYDLTSERRFRKLDLLESHTGLLKSKADWNTKYASFGQVSLTHLPFNRGLLYIYGDKHQIEPQPRKVRQMVFDISIKKKWTPYTTASKIRDDFRSEISHPADKQILLEFSYD